MRSARRPALPNVVQIDAGDLQGRHADFSTIILFYMPFSFKQPTGQTAERILTHDTSKDAKSRKVQIFGVKVIKINI